MQLPDVNILVDAFREDGGKHGVCRDWLNGLLNSNESFGVTDLVCSGFFRVVTSRRIFALPAPIDDALAFIERVRSQPNCVVIAPGDRHWGIFTNLCKTLDLRGNLIPDAYFAAMAIESGCEWITFDRDYARFPGLRWRRPGD